MNIHYQLPTPGPDKLIIYNIVGQAVRVLKNESRAEARSYEAVWDGKDERGRRVPVGAYFLRLEARGQRMTRQMVVVR